MNVGKKQCPHANRTFLFRFERVRRTDRHA
jgi:hypothetical protein